MHKGGFDALLKTSTLCSLAEELKKKNVAIFFPSCLV
jgi:hypothetical protein